MKYACIGEKLGHSFSKEIHNALGSYDYEIKEIPRLELDAFMKKADFLAINVTIPYKEAVMPYLDEISEEARSVGSVNTVVNCGGRLFGYNTDFFGLTQLLRHAKISVKGKKAAILGSGGTAKTARAVLLAEGAAEILTVSRDAGDGKTSYKDLSELHSDIEILINTTPVGMFPDIEKTPVDIDSFPNLSGVVDAIYNPLRTNLISRAKELGIPSEGGLYMLVAQAVFASELFLSKKYPETELERVYGKILAEKENIILIGMPSSGKSTVGKLISEMLCRPFYDTDELIAEKTGLTIPEIFEKLGEAEFRRIEKEAVLEISAKTGAVIATGGGVILNSANIDGLKRNGKVIFLDRELTELLPSEDRPLSKSADALGKLYSERYPKYLAAADITVKSVGSAEETLKYLISKL